MEVYTAAPFEPFTLSAALSKRTRASANIEPAANIGLTNKSNILQRSALKNPIYPQRPPRTRETLGSRDYETLIFCRAL
ncbi:hypothetical protein TSAR_013192 [Trichomalopsis sarcophagae]|uniref:Uncharacterized protein n=1 Tax=Trichomalopsis sarcophagae TaxID=543379 RepID=A0A232FCU2_9HYME|nr:hypothetical protein TSAR_013192 [Trichomalopsis sarcophagae]